MSQFKVTATYPIDLPDSTTGAPGQIVDCDPGDVAGAVAEGHLVPVSQPAAGPDEPIGGDQPAAADQTEPDKPEPAKTEHHRRRTTKPAEETQ